MVVKLMAIAAIGVFLFSSSGRMVDSTTVSRLIGPSVPLPNEGGY